MVILFRTKINFRNSLYFVLVLFYSCDQKSNKSSDKIEEFDSTNLIIEIKKSQQKLLDNQNRSEAEWENSTNNNNYSIDNQNNPNQKTSQNFDEIERYLRVEEAELKIIIPGYEKAKSDYLYSGEGNFPAFCEEIKTQYPRKLKELESFYLQYSSIFNSDQSRRYSDIKRKMENVFSDAIQTL